MTPEPTSASGQAPRPKRLLVLVHEFPPAAGGGVQRIAKFCKYLPESGWRPQVITTEIIEGRPQDDTLLDDVRDVPVVRLPHRDVTTAIARLIAPAKRLARGGGRSASASDAGAATPAPSADSDVGARVPLSARIAAWVSVPDSAARWASSVVDEVRRGDYSDVDAVLASGPPHSTLVAGARIAKELGVPLVADFRDAWRDYPVRITPTSWHGSRQEKLERMVVATAASALAVSAPIAEEVRSMGGTSVVVLPNGYDAADLPSRVPTDRAAAERTASADLALAFMGRFYANTDPTVTLRGIAAARAEGLDVTLDVVGPDAPVVVKTVTELGLGEAVRFRGYRPHREALELVARADVGLITIAPIAGTEAIYSGKLFEYLGMGMPVLLVGPADGAAAELVREAGAGEIAAPDDPAAVASALARLAAAAKRGALPVPAPEVVGRFERRVQARQLGGILDALARTR